MICTRITRGAWAFALALCVSPLGASAGTVVRGAETVGPPVVGIPIDVDMSQLPIVPTWRPGDAIREVPRRDDGSGNPVSLPATLDPLVAGQREFRGDGPALTTRLNFRGNNSSANPNDPTGDVGKGHFVEAINGPGGTSVTIYSKHTGTLLVAPFALDSLAPPGPCASGFGDPIVVYDALAERWLLTEFAQIGDKSLCLYTSRTSDPTAGTWCLYIYEDTSFPDYPKYGVWPGLYVATANQGASPPVYAFDRINMLSLDGDSCPVARAPQKVIAPDLPGLGFEAFTPADLDGPAPPQGAPAYVVRQRDEELNGDPGANPATDRIEVWSFDVDFDNAGNTTLSQLPDVIVAEFDSNLCPPISVFSCIPQPNSAPRLDPLLEIVMFRASYRNFGTHESLLIVLQVDVGDFEDHSGERWIEMRKSGGGDWALYQEGTYSPDATHRFMGMTAMDGDGNILLAYNVSSESVFPGIRYTGRLASDTLGLMTVPETVLAGGGATNSSSRYGDYNQMGVDPENDCTFYFLGMYNPLSKSIRIGAVEFDACTAPIFRDGFESGDTGTWEPPD